MVDSRRLRHTGVQLHPEPPLRGAPSAQQPPPHRRMALEEFFRDRPADRPADEDRRRPLHQHPRGRRARLPHHEPRPQRKHILSQGAPHARRHGLCGSTAVALLYPLAHRPGVREGHRRAAFAPHSQPQRALRLGGCQLDTSSEVHGCVVGDDQRPQHVGLHERLPLGAPAGRPLAAAVAARLHHRLHQGQAPRPPRRQQRQRAPLHRLRRRARFRRPPHRGLEHRLGRLVRQGQRLRLRLPDTLPRLRPAGAERVCPPQGHPPHYAPREQLVGIELRALHGAGLHADEQVRLRRCEERLRGPHRAPRRAPLQPAHHQPLPPRHRRGRQAQDYGQRPRGGAPHGPLPHVAQYDR